MLSEHNYRNKINQTNLSGEKSPKFPNKATTGRGGNHGAAAMANFERLGRGRGRAREVEFPFDILFKWLSFVANLALSDYGFYLNLVRRHGRGLDLRDVLRG
jgi:hypothetical protein